ncbi:MAG: hypothetical protein ACYDCK_00820, partial [Thermoplasmatota archaeon]
MRAIFILSPLILALAAPTAGAALTGFASVGDIVELRRASPATWNAPLVFTNGASNVDLLVRF